MSRSGAFRQLGRAIRRGLFCEKQGVSTSEGIERFAAKSTELGRAQVRRCDLLAGVGKAGLLGASSVGNEFRQETRQMDFTAKTVFVTGASRGIVEPQ
jgi:hypothetical protein